MNYQMKIGLPMVISEKKESGLTYIEIESIRGFSVEKTFDCGQCFRFERIAESAHETEFCGVVFGRFISVALDGERMTIYNCDREFFENKLYTYLGLCDDYEKIRSDIAARCSTEYMLSVMRYGEGIRILRQEKWEALCSFIISQNNNIPRIKKIIRALCERCGDAVDVSFMKEHGAQTREFSFPSPERVMELGIEGLRELRVGFRAGYIFDAASKIVSGEIDLEGVSSLPSGECIEALTAIKGVGLKVASCTALFGMEKFDSFPIDVWIRRVLDERFPKGFDPSTLGEYAGIAQQYMFYAARFD